MSLDPWGHLVAEVFADKLAAGWDIRPTIAVTKAHVNMPEIMDAMAAGRLKPDNDILSGSGDVKVTKAAIEPVWWLPGIAERFGVKEVDLRRTLFEQTGGMYTELVTRPDLELFLPPIGGSTIYFFGDVAKLGKPETKIACRLHDECNGSDVFGSDICTCRPYLAHGIEICIEMAQKGGVGVVIYNRKEGRALGEVTKFLVYNARKRQPGGDSAAQYFNRTECVAGVQDMRFQELMPDVFHWLGIARIDRFASMSNMKSDALREQGIEIVEQVPIPDELIPADAQVEMDAKKAAGYFTPTKPGRRPREAQGAGAHGVTHRAAQLQSRDHARDLTRHWSRALQHDDDLCLPPHARGDPRAGGAGAEVCRGRAVGLVVGRCQRPRGRGAGDARGHAQALPQSGGDSLPFALAAFRGRRPRPLGGAGAAARGTAEGRDRAPPHRSRGRVGAARRRRGSGLVLSRARHRRDLRALRRAGRRELPHVRQRRVQPRSPRAIRCASMPSGWRR